MTDPDPTTFEELLARRPGEASAIPVPEAATGPGGRGLDAGHGAVKVALGGLLWHAFGRRASTGAGWWFLADVELEIEASDGRGSVVVCPDLAAFRRRRGDPRPTGRPVRARPTWICEIGAAGAPGDDGARLEPYGRGRVPHAWIVDVARRTLTAYRWGDAGYAAALRAGPGETVRAEPFEQIALALDDVIGDG